MKKKEELRTDAMTDVKYRGNAMIRMLRYMKPYRPAVIASAIIVLAITFLELYKPILIGNAIDRYITGDYLPGQMADERFAGILRAAGIYLIVLLCLFVLSRTQYKLMQRTGQSIVYDMRNDIFTHVL